MAKVKEIKLPPGLDNDDESESSRLSEDEQAEDENNSEDDEGNAGWADSIAKVLSSTKPKSKKSVVLSRAKKEVVRKENVKNEKVDYGFEIEGEVKEEKPDKEKLIESIKPQKNVHLPLRVRPSWKDIERERTLRKVATRGVVQLFNAVRMQQKDLKHQLEEAGPLDSRKDAVLNNINKKKFLDVLMSGNRAKSEVVDNAIKYEKKERNDSSSDDNDDETAKGQKRKSEWSVLRPDFMTNKKIKHWDEEDENDETSNHSEDSSEHENDK